MIGVCHASSNIETVKKRQYLFSDDRREGENKFIYYIKGLVILANACPSEKEVLVYNSEEYCRFKPGDFCVACTQY